MHCMDYMVWTAWYAPHGMRCVACIAWLMSKDAHHVTHCICMAYTTWSALHGLHSSCKCLHNLSTWQYAYTDMNVQNNMLINIRPLDTPHTQYSMQGSW